MTAIINSQKLKTKRKVIAIYNTPTSRYYTLQLDGNASRTITNLRRVYPAEQLRIFDTLQCRKRQHVAYKRKSAVRGRIAA